MLAITWTHPVHDEVTEAVCPTHAQPARQALRQLSIKYTARLAADGPCHRCNGWRRWQHRRLINMSGSTAKPPER
jgi:hypothetical protein